MSDQRRFEFEPLLNLVTGRPVGLETHRCLPRDRTDLVAAKTVWGPRQLAEFDSGIAIASVLHFADHDAGVPLHIDLLADTVVTSRHRLGQLQSALRSRAGGDRAVPPIMIEVNPALACAPPDALAEAVAAVREDGFLVAFDAVGRGFGLDLIAELQPDLVKIDAQLVARLPTVPLARAVVKAICDVCRLAGIRTCAVGVGSREELAAVRDFGIAWAQGPLLAPCRAQPSTEGVLLPVHLMPGVAGMPVRMNGRAPVAVVATPNGLPIVGTLAQTAVSLPEHVDSESVRLAFAAHPHAGSVVLLDAQRRPCGFLDRNRFMLAISGPFGRALYASRPAAALAEAPRTIDAGMDIRAALEYSLAGDRSRSFDDLVLLDEDASCAGIVRVADLLQLATAVTAGSTSAA